MSGSYESVSKRADYAALIYEMHAMERDDLLISTAYLALRTAGFEDLSVYDGSWSEWSVDPETPKERH